MNDSPESDDDAEPHPVLFAFFDEMSCAGCAGPDITVTGRKPGPVLDYSKGSCKFTGFFKTPDSGTDAPVLVIA